MQSLTDDELKLRLDALQIKREKRAKAQEPMHNKRKKKNRKRDQIQKHSRKMNRR